MEKEPGLQEKNIFDLPVAERYPLGHGRDCAVDCPICGHTEHAPRIGEPDEIKECETFVRMGAKNPKKYKVVKPAA